MTTLDGGTPSPQDARATRVTFFLSVLALGVVAAGAGLLAERALAQGPGPSFGPLQLRLAYNYGVAFSMGNWLPAWLILAVTGVITMGVIVYGWRAAPAMPAAPRAGLAAVLAGACVNLVDRAIDGRVTDYLHTGWFPTFNLPDVYITCGAVLLIVGAFRPGSTVAIARSPETK